MKMEPEFVIAGALLVVSVLLSMPLGEAIAIADHFQQPWPVEAWVTIATELAIVMLECFLVAAGMARINRRVRS